MDNRPCADHPLAATLTGVAADARVFGLLRSIVAAAFAQFRA
ncbi:MAG: hypothetical protein AAB363_09970 [Planctomycetota bacterium]